MDSCTCVPMASRMADPRDMLITSQPRGGIVQRVVDGLAQSDGDPPGEHHLEGDMPNEGRHLFLSDAQWHDGDTRCDTKHHLPSGPLQITRQSRRPCEPVHILRHDLVVIVKRVALKPDVCVEFHMALVAASSGVCNDNSFHFRLPAGRQLAAKLRSHAQALEMPVILSIRSEDLRRRSEPKET